MNRCPCCDCPINLVGAGVIESHPGPESKFGAIARRAGPYCNGSGYTVDQARRWSSLSFEEQTKRLDSPTREVA